MTREDVERQLIAIAHEAHTSPAAAAERERRLFRDVLLELARGGGKSAELASTTLRAWELEFDRTRVA